MAKRWRILAHDPESVAALERGAGIPAVVARLLSSRGIRDPDAARDFLHPKLSQLRDPDRLPGCTQAARRIHEALQAGWRIVVYGDYDVDGITGTALLYLCLKMLGGNVGYYIPHRLEEGYGLHEEAIRRLAAEQAQMLVTVDCGISSVEEAAAARASGLELIITDHHEPGRRLPEASAIVHPHLPGQEYPFAHLSGSGVALKLAWALCQQASGAKRVGQQMREFLLKAVGLAALGTVADVVPLVDENRVLVRHGLVALREYPILGIEALIAGAGLSEKRILGSEDVAFNLGPRLNAVGRLGEGGLAVELLTTDRAERAQELAQHIHQLNERRQGIERSLYLAAQKQARDHFDPERDPALVLADRGWHAGVIGIVAGRLAERYHRPVVLISWDPMGLKPGQGSARSVPGFDLYAALEACREHLVRYGGHAAAAGLTLLPDRLAEFRRAFCQYAASAIPEEARVAELRIDAEAPLSALTLHVTDQIEQMAPFGPANARPLLCASGVTLAEPPRPIGADGRHLALQLRQHDVVLRAVAFGGGEWAEQLAEAERPLDVAFRPMINSFRGRRSVELQLVDWRTTTLPDP